MEIKLQSNLLTQISKDQNSNSWYYMKDESMNIDVTIYINEKNKVTITGLGSKKLNSYIKGCFEEYKIQIKDFNNLKESMEILLSNIEQLSSNKISFENISISKENGIYKTFFTVYKIDEYSRKRLGYIIIDSNTFEILENSHRVNEDLEKFISAYNNYIHADENNIENENINNIIYQVETRTGGSIIKNFNNKADAMNYYNENKKYNVVYRELISIGEYYYSNGNNCIALYNNNCNWLCTIKNTENNITEEYIKESLNNYFSNYMPVFGDVNEEIEIIDQVTNNEIAASTSIESIPSVTQNIPELSSEGNNNSNELQSIKDKINSLDHEIDQLDDQYKLIQNNRISLGYSLAIYKCDDIHALKLIKIDKQIKQLEQQQDTLRAEYNQLFYAKYKDESLLYHAKFNNSKYEIIYNNDTSNKIYTNDIEEYKNKAIQDGVNIIINEYIDYNKTINIEVNKPILITIYKYDSNNKTYFNSIPHQLNYASYKEEYKDLDGNILQLIERGYTTSNKEVYTRIINAWGDEAIYIYNDSIVNSITITKYRDSREYYIMERTIKHYKLNTLNKDMQDILNKVLKSLSSNKQYKYDVDYIKKFMTV